MVSAQAAWTTNTITHVVITRNTNLSSGTRDHSTVQKTPPVPTLHHLKVSNNWWLDNASSQTDSLPSRYPAITASRKCNCTPLRNSNSSLRYAILLLSLTLSSKWNQEWELTQRAGVGWPGGWAPSGSEVWGIFCWFSSKKCRVLCIFIAKNYQRN